MTKDLNLTDGGIGQILYAIAGIFMLALQQFTPTSRSVLTGIAVSSLVFVGSALLLVSTQKVSRDYKGSGVGVLSAAVGLVTATIGLVLFGLAFSDITFHTSDYIYYLPTELGSLLSEIWYILTGVTWILLGSAFTLHSGLFTDKERWMATGVTYVIVGALYFTYALSLMIAVIFYVYGYGLGFTLGIFQAIAGTMGSLIYFTATQEKRR